MAKKKSSRKPKKAKFNSEQFEAHALDSLSKDMKTWDIPWSVCVFGNPNSSDVKIMIAGKPANIDKAQNMLFMKSLMTIAVMALQEGLDTDINGLDILDA
jgi:hypothetical protein